MFNHDIYCLEGEEWRDIPDYEGVYQASSLGRIRTIDGKVTYSVRHGKRVWKGRILKNKTKIPNNSGYKVTLWKNKEPKDLLVARLVCMAFYGIPDGIEIKGTGKRMTVNHKDGNRLNNNINNLEWLTLADNIQHAFKTGLMTNQKQIVLIDEKTSYGKMFNSLSEASRFLGRNNGYISNKIKKRKNIFISTDGVEYRLFK